MSETDLLKTKSDDEILEMLSKGENAFVVQRFEAIKKEVVDRGLAPKYNQTKFLVQRKDGKQPGPHTAAEIKVLFSQGELTKDSKIHVQSIYGWTTLTSVFDVGLWVGPDVPKESSFPAHTSSELRADRQPYLPGNPVNRHPTPSNLPSPILKDPPAQSTQIPSRDGTEGEQIFMPPSTEGRVEDTNSIPSPYSDAGREYSIPGIGRRNYFLALVGFLLLLPLSLVIGMSISEVIAPFLLMSSTIGFIWATVARLRNIGHSGWWVLTIFIPFLGSFIWIVLVLYCCFARTGSSAKTPPIL